MDAIKATKLLVHVLLFIIIALFIITGFGITDYQLVGSITFGMLTKPVSYQLHSNLVIPLVVLLMLHIIFVLGKRFTKQQ
jgi:hypothetical protein